MAARKYIFEVIAGTVFLAVLIGLDGYVDPDLKLLLYAVIAVSVLSIVLSHIGMACAGWIGQRILTSHRQPAISGSVSKEPQPYTGRS